MEAINRLNRSLYRRLSLSSDHRFRVYDQKFFVSRTTLAPDRYRSETVVDFLDRLRVSKEEYERGEVFMLRSTLMNPWYDEAKRRGRYYLVDLVDELYTQAADIWREG